MAIMKSLALDSGLVIDQAYIKVQGINGNKNIACISLEVFISKEKRDEGKTPIAYFNYTFVPMVEDNSPRWDKQAYEYLKTLGEFAGAIDV